MSKEIYVPVDGKAHKTTKFYAPVNGVARSVKKAYKGVNGVARQFYEAKKSLAEFEIGDTVFLNVSGKPLPFLVVNRGIPSNSTLYDRSCDGIWLLMRDSYYWKVWDDSNNNKYANSGPHSYVNIDFLKLLDERTKAAIKQVKIPYRDANGSIASGSNGLSVKAFLLSGYEVGFTTANNSNLPLDGACLSYFNGADHSKRVARSHYDGMPVYWWLRSTPTQMPTHSFCIRDIGDMIESYASNNYAIRPALILEHNTKFDPKTNVIL